MERINGRVLAIVVALLLAAVATVALRDYVEGEADIATEDAELVVAYATTADLPPGTTFASAQAAQVIKMVKINREAFDVLPDPLTTLDSLEGKIVVRALKAGAFLTTGDFGDQAVQAEAFTVPDGMVAVSVDIGITPGVANFIDTGDHVDVVAHLAAGGDAGASGPTTRILLHDVEILAIGLRTVPNNPSTGREVINRANESLTITFALTPSDAERLVFAQFESSLYLLLLPQSTGEFTPSNTTGRNADNLFGS